MKIRWPRGRYNGRRITGGKVSFGFDLSMFDWRPTARMNFGQPYFIWLGFVFRAERTFE